MGQQQLLLLVLGIIIVGVAIIAGMYAWEDQSAKVIADNLVNRNLEIANSAVFWKTKLDPFNGGNASYAGLAEDGMEKLSMNVETNYGTFAITAATASTVEITGVSKRDPNIGARTFVSGHAINQTDVSFTGGITLDGEED
ncbi:MAG: hypothetical protein RIE53_11090 [Rhodothermales bacterium]